MRRGAIYLISFKSSIKSWTNLSKSTKTLNFCFFKRVCISKGEFLIPMFYWFLLQFIFQWMNKNSFISPIATTNINYFGQNFIFHLTFVNYICLLTQTKLLFGENIYWGKDFKPYFMPDLRKAASNLFKPIFKNSKFSSPNFFSCTQHLMFR